ncbi:NAD(P)/FAD-dependent oxidoreductase [Micromonospora sp. NPDC006766]|uniref:flavin-containing monooxygenase n=1 Tax=Micromonospora sp. NPDC006766 TaxID=3154778 RepID=UPI0033C11096
MKSSQVDVIVVGAGLAGLRAVHSVREAGFTVQALEAASGIGGVWHWNRYPGARCDVESYDYSYSFSEELEQEWRWTERYATQPEILRYIEHVADRFDLRRYVKLNTRVVKAQFDEDSSRWTVQTEHGEQYDAAYVIMATGQLSVTKLPEIEGFDDFAGQVLHTGQWPHDPVDFTGKRVGVIGTGSSGVQLIPIVAREAAHLTVFQRTPTFTVPANNRPIDDVEDADIKARYATRREAARMSANGLGFDPGKKSLLEATEAERIQRLEQQYQAAGFGFALAYPDILLDEKANEKVADFLREKIRLKVQDPRTAERLTPYGYPFGAKRPAVDSGYYEAFNRDNVSLVDISAEPLERITVDGLVAGGREHELDVIVFATGFDALTGSLLKPTIVGRAGQTLREKWAAGPVTYLGLGTTGFPNLFIIAGPGSPSVLANVLLGIEQHVDWIVQLLHTARARGVAEIEATPEAEHAWVEHVNERARRTLYLKAASWYLGADVPGKPRVFMPYTGGHRGYRRICDEVAANDYEGFDLITGSEVAQRRTDRQSHEVESATAR